VMLHAYDDVATLSYVMLHAYDDVATLSYVLLRVVLLLANSRTSDMTHSQV